MAADTGVSVVGRWFIGTASALGVAHAVDGGPNQDASGFAAAGDSVVIAVADGHGDPRHFRSDRGAQFAVDSACEAGAELAGQLDALGKVDEVVDLVTERLLPDVIDRWEERVAADVMEDPFPGDGTPLASRADVVVPYGSTLLLAVVSPIWAVTAQIGDGDVVVVGGGRQVTCPVPGDPLVDGRHTTSLCQENAAANFRLAAIDLIGFPVAAILLATDGYGDSQAEDPWQPPVGVSIAQLAADQGIAWVTGQVAEWAARCASADGSGDDTSLALAINTTIGSDRPPRSRSRLPGRRSGRIEGGGEEGSSIVGLGPDRGEGRPRIEG
ncbi:MAG TPA: protein phosphatase 2C domain-containing protein [Actinomycetota bacterium]|nr:protein phosphatase 2C domain-containing protein [Actinomycetota bacterium]